MPIISGYMQNKEGRVETRPDGFKPSILTYAKLV